MGTRLQLSALLNSLCENVYFQAPENVKMQYPAIEYHPDDEIRQHADNRTYLLTDKYQVTIMDRDPDSPIRAAFRQLPGVDFVRHDVFDELNQFIYTLNY